MPRLDGWRCCCLLWLVLLPVLAVAVPAPPESPITLNNHDQFFPHRQHKPLPGKVVGLLLADGQQALGLEGRSGPPNQLVFSADGNSYRWVYVEVNDANPQIRDLRVPVGAQGGVKVYPKLAIANPENVKRWRVSVPYALVEVEVNGGEGSPAGDSFVATHMRVLGETEGYPPNVSQTVADLRMRYRAYQAEQKGRLDEDMEKARQEAIGQTKATGPRTTSTVIYATWLNDTKRLQVRFLTKVSDGVFMYVEGGARPEPQPAPLPAVPPRPLPQAVPAPAPVPPAPILPAEPRPLPDVPQALPAPAQQVQAAPVQLVPPPPPVGVRTGTEFGIHYGVQYEVNTAGALVKTEVLPPRAFKTVLPPPPVFRRPFELPPPPPAIPPR